jgi:protein-S-isoprenylcysteine O-methyltransferase Ste14
MRLLAFKELGKDFTFHLTKPKRLNTSGLYSLVQHPSYTGVVLSNAANTMFLYRLDGISACFLPGWIVRQAWWANWTLFFVTAMISTYGTRVRVRREEEMLQKEFGKEWEEWHAKTKRFIPFIF